FLKCRQTIQQRLNVMEKLLSLIRHWLHNPGRKRDVPLPHSSRTSAGSCPSRMYN
ncbi:hypothetical protein L9F63_002795, partial [Diploptera punctata]